MCQKINDKNKFFVYKIFVGNDGIKSLTNTTKVLENACEMHFYLGIGLSD